MSVLQDFKQWNISRSGVKDTSILSGFHFTDALDFDQSFEGVPSGSFLPGIFGASDSQEGIQIKSDNTNNESYLQSKNFTSGSTGWRIDSNGDLEANSGTFTGTITASSGSIGGFNIGSNFIRDSANSMGLSSAATGGDDVRFWAGDTFANRASAEFRVTESGALVATNATITGSITATSGSIGGWDIAANTIESSGGEIKLDSSNITLEFEAQSAIGETSSIKFVEAADPNDYWVLMSGQGNAERLHLAFTTNGGSSFTTAAIFNVTSAGAYDDIQFGDSISLNTSTQAVSMVLNGSGDIVFTPDTSSSGVLPGANDTYDLGETNANWLNVYCNKIVRDNDTNVIDMSLTNQIKMNQPLSVVNASGSAADANSVKIFSTDLSAGNTQLAWYGEGTPVGSGTPVANTTIAVEVNGTQYYLIASTVAI